MATKSTATPSAPYPVRLNIDYPDRQLNRLSSFFRIIAIIPIYFILALLSGGNVWGGGDDNAFAVFYTSALSAGALLAVVLLILFRQKYPKWIFDWNFALARFSNRVFAYAYLLRDEYPSVDEEQAVHLEIDYPNAKELNRWLPLVKWLLLLPHYIVLIFLCLISFILTVVAWFAILFTGRYPKGIFTFNVGLQRWMARIFGYGFYLVTDKYPPFSLD